MWPVALIAAAVVIAVGWVISVSNRFKVLLVKIMEADSGIDVALIKRYDTLTKLVDVVRSYTKHESDLLLDVIKVRADMDIAAKSEASLRMDAAASKIHVIAEAYPELRSSENYKQLQNTIVEAEDHLQAARRVYNMNVSAFNQSIVRFPGSIIASKSNYTPKEFFAADENKRADVKIVL